MISIRCVKLGRHAKCAEQRVPRTGIENHYVLYSLYVHHSYVSLTDVYIFLRIAISAIVYVKVVFLYISLNLCCVYRHAFAEIIHFIYLCLALYIFLLIYLL